MGPSFFRRQTYQADAPTASASTSPPPTVKSKRSLSIDASTAAEPFDQLKRSRRESKRNSRTLSAVNNVRGDDLELASHSIDVRIPVSDNISLEGVLKVPDPLKTLPINKLVIMCHPWSWLGGCMDDPVLEGLSTAFLQLDYHVVQFNNRGVGVSGGRSSFTGVPESQDLQKVVAWALEEVLNVHTVVLLGYSYGSLITSLCPSPGTLFPERIARSAHILLSHALGPVHFLTLFNSAKYAEALDRLLVEPKSHVLVVYGDQDQFTSAHRYQNWIEHSQGVRKMQERRLQKKKSGAKVLDSPAIVTTPKEEPDGTIRPTVSNPTGDYFPHGVVYQSTVQRSACGEYQATLIPHADHFWRGVSGRRMHVFVTEWIKRLDAGDFDPPEDD